MLTAGLGDMPVENGGHDQTADDSDLHYCCLSATEGLDGGDGKVLGGTYVG
jgi:hypothetical protein